MKLVKWGFLRIIEIFVPINRVDFVYIYVFLFLFSQTTVLAPSIMFKERETFNYILTNKNMTQLYNIALLIMKLFAASEMTKIIFKFLKINYNCHFRAIFFHLHCEITTTTKEVDKKAREWKKEMKLFRPKWNSKINCNKNCTFYETVTWITLVFSSSYVHSRCDVGRKTEANEYSQTMPFSLANNNNKQHPQHTNITKYEI